MTRIVATLAAALLLALAGCGGDDESSGSATSGGGSSSGSGGGVDEDLVGGEPVTLRRGDRDQGVSRPDEPVAVRWGRDSGRRTDELPASDRGDL